MNVVSRRQDGSLCFQWTFLDRVIDAMLDLGIRPFLELNPMPLALASGSQTIFQWKLNCASMSWWIVSDVFGEHGISPLPFSHAYGLLTVHGIPKATWHAFKWLSRMRGARYAVEGLDGDPRKGMLATRDAGGALRVLMWYHPPREAAEGEWADTLRLSLETPALLTRAALKAGRGSAYEAWTAWGSPPTLTPSQQDALEALSAPLCSGERIGAGSHEETFRLAPYEVLFLEFAPSEAPAVNRGIYKEQSPELLEAQLAAKTSG